MFCHQSAAIIWGVGIGGSDLAWLPLSGFASQEANPRRRYIVSSTKVGVGGPSQTDAAC
jgi:hypothetical protein